LLIGLVHFGLESTKKMLQRLSKNWITDHGSASSTWHPMKYSWWMNVVHLKF